MPPRLNLSDNPALDYTPLAELTKLSFLHIGHPSDLGFLSKMSGMKDLSLVGGWVEGNDFSPIGELGKIAELWRLRVKWAKELDLEDLNFDGEKDTLTDLTLNGSGIRNFSEIEKLQKLNTLSLSRCKLLDKGANLKSIGGLGNLRYLLMHELKPTDAADYSPLGKLNLDYVLIDYNKTNPLNPITPEEIVLAKWYQADIVDYVVAVEDKELKKAIQAALDYPDWKDIHVRDLSKMTTLDLRDYAVKDFSGLEEAVALEQLLVDADNLPHFNELNSEKDAEIARLNGVMKSKNDEIKRLREVIADLREVIKGKNDEITRLRGVIADLREQLNNKDTEIADLREQLEEAIAMARVPFVDGWFYEPAHGWLYTDVNHYPLVYRHDTASWYYYDPGSSPRFFYNYKTGEWECWDPEKEEVATIESSDGN